MVACRCGGNQTLPIHTIVMIIVSIIRIGDLCIIITIAVNQRFLDGVCWKGVDARACNYVGVIILVPINIIVGVLDHLVELEGIHLL